MKINTQFLFRVFEVTLVCIGFYKYFNFSLTNNEAAARERPFQLCHQTGPNMHAVKEVAPVVAESLLTSTITNFSNIPATIGTQPASSQLQKAGLGFVSNESKEQQGSGPLLVWVDGQARSGTTLMHVLLDAHPDINCGPETNIFLNTINYIHTEMVAKASYSKLDSYSHTNIKFLVLVHMWLWFYIFDFIWQQV